MKEWFFQLAKTDQDAILWTGFWTDPQVCKKCLRAHDDAMSVSDAMVFIFFVLFLCVSLHPCVTLPGGRGREDVKRAAIQLCQLDGARDGASQHPAWDTHGAAQRAKCVLLGQRNREEDGQQRLGACQLCLHHGNEGEAARHSARPSQQGHAGKSLFAGFSALQVRDPDVGNCCLGVGLLVPPNNSHRFEGHV